MRWLFPVLALALAGATVIAAPGLAQRFRVDSSTDSMVLEADPDAIRYDRTALLFTSDEFVLVGLTRDDLFTPEGVAAVASLHAAFAAIDGVESVLSLTSVPLFRSFAGPVPPLAAVMRQARITDPALDLAKAKAELTDHELYRGNLVDAKGRTAGILVTLRRSPESVEVTRERLRLLDERAVAKEALALASSAPAGEMTDRVDPATARERLARAQAALDAHHATWVQAEDARKAERRRVVDAVRVIVARERAAGAEIQASGVPAIVVEMVEAIQEDLRLFFGLSALFLIAFLGLVFRRVRWVVLPLMATGATVVWTVGLMELVDRRATIITANIPSLLLVIGLAHSIHLIVGYREHLVRHPDDSPTQRARRLVRAYVWPCLFTATTTAAGFLSLYFAGSRPIIDFGFFMAAGVGLAFLFSFVFLPAAVMLLPASGEGRLERSAQALQSLARASLRRRWVVVGATAAVVGVSAWGISRMQVEARFVDYFDEASPIHRGLTYIDEHLGGTSGLEVVLSSDEAGAFGLAHPENLERAAEVVAWLEAQPQVGAVMSYVGMVDELRKLFPEADRRAAAGFIGRFVDAPLLAPYVVTEATEVGGREVLPFSAVRIVARVQETNPDLRRAELLAALKAFLRERFPPGGAVTVDATASAPAPAPAPEGAGAESPGAEGAPGAEAGVDRGGLTPADGATGLRAEVTGMFVLYANMLQSLVTSQVVTSVLALSAIWVMLALLFRSPGAALLGVLPNLVPITFVLGAMGWAGIPLDMATVMIASVSLGIGIDCAIHYLFRYRAEVARDGDVAAALIRSHGSIGTSIFLTSLTSVVGFAVLMVSNFRPNAYFGLFTGFAMIAALFAMLTLLPVLVAWFHPFRKAEAAGRALAAPPLTSSASGREDV